MSECPHCADERDRVKVLIENVQCIRNQLAKVEQKRDALLKALRWYEEIAVSIQRYLAEKKDAAILACLTELDLDGGKRARRARGEEMSE